MAVSSVRNAVLAHNGGRRSHLSDASEARGVTGLIGRGPSGALRGPSRSRSDRTESPPYPSRAAAGLQEHAALPWVYRDQYPFYYSFKVPK